MADPEHLERLRQGVKTWNEWRKSNDPSIGEADIVEWFKKVIKKYDSPRIDLKGAKS